MALANQTYVVTPTDYPLDALVEGTHYKADLVANLAFNDGAEASAEHYGLPVSHVYSAMVFYLDNEAAINKSIDDMSELGKKLGEKNVSENLAEIRNRVKKS